MKGFTTKDTKDTKVDPWRAKRAGILLGALGVLGGQQRCLPPL
jgi:hypothetical protein